MGLETGTYISDLVASNPVHISDDVGEGDDHIRLIKACLLNTLPGLTGVMNATHTELNNLVGITGKTGSGNLVLSASPTFSGTITGGIFSGDGSLLTALNAANLASGNIPDARVPASAVTQHVASINHDALLNFVANEHIDHSAVSITAGDGLSGGGTIAATRSLAVDSTVIRTGALTQTNSDAAQAGFKGCPINTQNGNYTLVLADAGKTIRKASGGAGETITIPANSSEAFPIGTVIVIHNDGGGDLSIAITTDTLEQFVTGSTGTRTLADNGKAVLEKVGSTTWKISGLGLS
jgi:hypothetical protein